MTPRLLALAACLAVAGCVVETTGPDAPECGSAADCAGLAVAACEVALCTTAGTCEVVTTRGAVCDDGDPCTWGDLCGDSGCVPGTQPDCSSPGACWDDGSCDPGTGECAWEPLDQTAACDDGDPGTRLDACDGAGGCAGEAIPCEPGPCVPAATTNGETCDLVLAPAGAPCDDGSLATEGDLCDGAGTCSGEPIDCTPGLCVVSGEPNGHGCSWLYEDATTPCDDGDLATGPDACDGAGACVGAPIDCPPEPCAEGAGTPNGEGCDYAWRSGGAPCDDGDATTRDDVCGDDGHVCEGTLFECEPGPCTRGFVADGEGCEYLYVAADAPCDDGDPATAGDVCDGAGGCAGAVIECPDAPCHAATPNGLSCDYAPAGAGTACDDDDLTTGPDQCDDQGACVGTPILCPSGPCVLAATPDGVTCQVTLEDATAACDDGDPATKDDQCDAEGQCAGAPIQCPDAPDTACVLAWLPDGEACAPVYAAVGAWCDDDDPVSWQTCDGEGECIAAPPPCEALSCQAPTFDGHDCSYAPAPDDAPCDDGNACTTGDACVGGTCAATGAVDCEPLDECHAPGVCDPESGVCSDPALPDGTPCGDGDLCTQGDACSAGSCQPGSPVDCGAAAPCQQTPECDPETGACVAADPCPDGFVCSLGGEAPWCVSDDGAAVLVPAGPFWMGCNVDDPYEAAVCDADEVGADGGSPLMQVPAFAIDRTEVTGGAYLEFLDTLATAGTPNACPYDEEGTNNGCVWTPTAEGWVTEHRDHPMVGVSWYGARAFCAWRGEQTAEPWRLCAESEWEKAARGGCETLVGAIDEGDVVACAEATRVYPWSVAGEATTAATCDEAWMALGADGSDPGCGAGAEPTLADSFQATASPYGAQHLSGNVWEWVEDCHHATYEGHPDDGSAWTDPASCSFDGGAGSVRVRRGGGFESVASQVRPAERSPLSASVFADYLGFRCCRSVAPGQ